MWEVINLSKVFYKDKHSIIVNDDILKTDIIRENSIDLIITSPPYNLGINYGIIKDNLEYNDYLKFSNDWLQKCFSFAKEDGRICINVPLDTSKNGSIGADITSIAQKAGWKYKTTIIWNKTKVSGLTARGTWMSAKKPNIISPVELIIVMYKEIWDKLLPGVSDISQNEFKEWTNGLWNFPGERRKPHSHPAPFPIELPLRCIKMFSYKSDVILDPFMGSGTTLYASHMLGRCAYGIEINRSYCEIAMNRLLKLHE